MSYDALRCVGGPMDGRTIHMESSETIHAFLDVSADVPDDALAKDVPALGWYIRWDTEDGQVARWRPRDATDIGVYGCPGCSARFMLIADAFKHERETGHTTQPDSIKPALPPRE